MKNKTLIILLVVSFCINLIQGYSSFSGKESKKEGQLAVDIKCASFLPELKKRDDERYSLDDKNMIIQHSEVFFSTIKNACLSLQTTVFNDLKNGDTAESSLVINLFTNETLLSNTFLGNVNNKSLNKANSPDYKFFTEELAKLKLEK